MVPGTGSSWPLRGRLNVVQTGDPASFRVEWTVKFSFVLILAKDLLKYHYNEAEY